MGMSAFCSILLLLGLVCNSSEARMRFCRRQKTRRARRFAHANASQNSIKWYNTNLITWNLSATIFAFGTLEHTVYGNGHKGLKAELIELKTEIETFKKIAVWQIGILIAILCAVLKILIWYPTRKSETSKIHLCLDRRSVYWIAPRSLSGF